MKPPAFDYVRADSMDEALAVLAEHGDEVRVLAGGQSLVPMLNMRLVQPRVLVDVSRLEALAYVRASGGDLVVGAAATQAALARHPDLARLSPLLHRIMPFVGHYQTRNRGTVCGSIAHADPSSELPLALAALGGEVVLRSSRRRRVLTADGFQRGMLQTAREVDEMIEAVRFPSAGPGAGCAFREVSERHGDFALVAVAAIVLGDTTRLAVGGVADRPEVRTWPRLDGDALDDALNDFAWELGGVDDSHASARYRRELVRRVGRRAIQEATACCA